LIPGGHLCCAAVWRPHFWANKTAALPDITAIASPSLMAETSGRPPVQGGTATRLTAHPGIEVFANSRLTGNWIAFTGQYDATNRFTVIPRPADVPNNLRLIPRRAPWLRAGAGTISVDGWSKDGKRIFFRSLRDSWTLPIARLYSVSVDGGPAEGAADAEAGSGDYSPDGSRMVVLAAIPRLRSEKRYGGGQRTFYTFSILKTSENETHLGRTTPGARCDVDGESIYFTRIAT